MNIKFLSAMLKGYIYWIVLLSVIGCNSTKNVVGNYSSEGIMMINHTLIIKENGRFEYHIKGDLSDASSYGTWRLLNHDIVLKSDSNLRYGVVKSIEEINPSTEGFYIKLLNEDGIPLSGASILVNGNSLEGFVVNKNGEGHFKFTDLHSLTISFLGTEYEYVLKKPKTNHLILTIRLQNMEVFFVDEVWKVKRTKLIGDHKNILYKK